MSREVPALRILPSIETTIRELRRCEVGCPMARTLDQQLYDLRVLANKIKEKYGIELPDDLFDASKNLDTARPDNAEGLDLIREMLEKILRLDAYIDSLR